MIRSIRRRRPRKMSSASDRRTPFMIGVAGGTASGKSTVCERLMEGLGQNEVSVEEKQVLGREFSSL